MKKQLVILATFATLLALLALPISKADESNEQYNDHQPELQEETLLECRVQFNDASTPIDGLYKVLRFGDTLFARYRHAPERELLQTDDVIFKRYTSDDLDQLNQNGLLDQLVASAGTQRSLVNEVVYYGIEETDTTEGFFEMNVYRLFTIGGIGLGKVARLHNQTDNLFNKCQ
jgi:hypothetical protein